MSRLSFNDDSVDKLEYIDIPWRIKESLKERIIGIDYYHVLNNNLLQSAERMFLDSLSFWRTQNTSKMASKFFTEKSLNLNSIENLWTILDEQFFLNTIIMKNHFGKWYNKHGIVFP